MAEWLRLRTVVPTTLDRDQPGRHFKFCFCFCFLQIQKLAIDAYGDFSGEELSEDKVALRKWSNVLFAFFAN